MDSEETDQHQSPDTSRDSVDSQGNSRDETGGVSLNGPLGFAARFPRSVAGESKWIIRGIAVAIPILALLYGLSFVLSLLAGISLWIFTRNTSGH